MKIGQIIDRGIMPCTICNKIHVLRIKELNPIYASWEMNSHDYHQPGKEAIIQFLLNEREALKERLKNLNLKRRKP